MHVECRENIQVFPQCISSVSFSVCFWEGFKIFSYPSLYVCWMQRKYTGLPTMHFFSFIFSVFLGRLQDFFLLLSMSMLNAEKLYRSSHNAFLHFFSCVLRLFSATGIKEKKNNTSMDIRQLDLQNYTPIWTNDLSLGNIFHAWQWWFSVQRNRNVISSFEALSHFTMVFGKISRFFLTLHVYVECRWQVLICLMYFFF